MMMCHHCGMKFAEGICNPLTPQHSYPDPVIPATMPFDIVDLVPCPGSEQNPRNAETDKRRLWKGGGES